MTFIQKWWKAESATIIGIILALAGAGFVPGAWGKLVLTVLPLIGAGAVRQTVFAPQTVVDTVTAAATSVASQLSPVMVGAAGEVPVSAQAVVDGVVAGVLGTK